MDFSSFPTNMTARLSFYNEYKYEVKKLFVRYACCYGDMSKSVYFLKNRNDFTRLICVFNYWRSCFKFKNSDIK